MNEWQAAFCVWNANRLGLSLEVSQQRLARSMAAFDGGYGALVHDALAVFADDSADESFDAYRMHALPHFLRMLSYPECAMAWPDEHPILRAFGGARHVSIIDYGCGLAQFSITLQRALTAKGAAVSLFLADIPTLRADFLQWLADAVFIPITETDPLPALPFADVIVATELFEHLHDPMHAFAALDARLLPGGFLVTNVNDHAPEFFHVSPDLSAVREALTSYQEIEPRRLYRKP